MTQITKIVDSRSIDLDELFNNTLLYIPPYQRPYSWEERQVRELWSDIYQCFEEEDLHFIGPMYFKYVVKDTENWLEVTDGQQRITSIYLLLLAFRRLLKVEYNYELLHSDTTYLFINHKIETMTIKGGKSRLQLGASDRFAFDLISNHYDTVPATVKEFGKLFKENEVFLASARLLHHNFFYFYNQLQKIHFDDFKASPEYADNPKLSNKNENYLHFRKKELVKFKNIFDTITDRFSMIRCIISTDDESRVFKLFETINDRGRPLDQVDKVKNYLFMNVYNFYKMYKRTELTDVFQEVQDNWSEVQENLDNHIEDYLRFFIVSRDTLGRHVKKKNLYYEINKYFETQLISNLKNFINENSLSDQSLELLILKNSVRNLDELRELAKIEVDDVVIQGIRAYESRRFIENLAAYCRSYLLVINPTKTIVIKDLVIRSNLKYSLDYTICRTLLLRLIMDYRDKPTVQNLDRLRQLVIITTNVSLLYVGVFGLGKMDAVEEELYKVFFKDSSKTNFIEEKADFSEKLVQSMSKVAPKFAWTQGSLTKQISECNNDSVGFIIQCKLNDYKAKKLGSADYFYPKALIEPVESFALNKDHILPQKPNADYQILIDEYYINSEGSIPLKRRFDSEVTKRIGNIIPIYRATNIRATNGQHLPFFRKIEPKGILMVELLSLFKVDQPWLPCDVEVRSNIIAAQVIEENVLTLDESKVKF